MCFGNIYVKWITSFIFYNNAEDDEQSILLCQRKSIFINSNYLINNVAVFLRKLYCNKIKRAFIERGICYYMFDAKYKRFSQFLWQKILSRAFFYKEIQMSIFSITR